MYISNEDNLASKLNYQMRTIYSYFHFDLVLVAKSWFEFKIGNEQPHFEINVLLDIFVEKFSSLNEGYTDI